MTSISNILGKFGEIVQPIVDGVSHDVVGSCYRFTDEHEFKRLLPEEMARVYWSELLYRAHWAASSNILRHKRWADACVTLYEHNANYLAFCVALRGLTESSADAAHSLGAVALTLAENHQYISTALNGTATGVGLCKDLEDMLIHFQYARKLKKDEFAPVQHKAENLTTYIKSIELQVDPIVMPLYQHLCGIVHPAADSLHWLSTNVDGAASPSPGDDKEWVRALCDKHCDAIEHVQMMSVNTSILILKTINFFDLSGLRTESVERINTSTIEMWNKIDRVLNKNTR